MLGRHRCRSNPRILHQGPTISSNLRIPPQGTTVGSYIRVPPQDPTLGFHLRVTSYNPTLGPHLKVPPSGPTLGFYLRVPPQGPGPRVPLFWYGVLEVLVSVGTFTITCSFATQSIQLVTMNELKKFMPGGLLLFTFYRLVPYSVYFLLAFRATSYNAMFVGRSGKCIYPQWRSIFPSR